MTRPISNAWVAAIAALLLASAAPAQQPCIGDCNGDGTVSINELITGVNIALGNAPLSACPAFDADGSGTVTINELITAVNNALGTCPGGPTPTPGVGILREYVLAPGVLLAPPEASDSGIFTTGLSGSNAANPFPADTLRLLLGVPDANGVASLTLEEDITLDLSVVDGSRLCLMMFAEDSNGSIDCNGGTPYDILATRPSLAPGVVFDVQTGLGAPAGPGNGNLLVMLRFQRVATGITTPCDQITYENPIQLFGFTTTDGTSVVEGTTLTLTVAGEPFDCDNFQTPGSGGQLAAPAPANQDPIGDVANVFRFGELSP